MASDLFDHIYSLIESTEHRLSNSRLKYYSSEIDINKEGWIEEARRQAKEFSKKHERVVEKVTEVLLSSFKQLDIKERSEIRSLLNRSPNLVSELHLPLHEDRIENVFLLFIVRGLGADTRDAMMELDRIISFCIQKSLDYKGMLESVIPFASDINKHGMGSMKDLLGRIMSR